jgi:hypothetical protein
VADLADCGSSLACRAQSFRYRLSNLESSVVDESTVVVSLSVEAGLDRLGRVDGLDFLSWVDKYPTERAGLDMEPVSFDLSVSSA